MKNFPALKQAQIPDIETPILGVGLPELGTVQQAADFMGCSVASVWRDVDKERIRPPIKIGGRTRFVMAELVASIEAKMAARSK